MNCRGDEDIDAKRSRPSIGKPVMGHAKKERVSLFGTDQRITSGPAARRPHSKAEYMTAPERFADSQIPLAPRAPSIHDPELTLADFRVRTCPAAAWRRRWLFRDHSFRRGARRLFGRRDHECDPGIPAVGPVLVGEFPIALEIEV